jgi:hypothetical protein
MHAAIAPLAGDRQLFLHTEESIPALLSAKQELHYYCRQIIRHDKSKADKAPNHMNKQVIKRNTKYLHNVFLII